MNKSLKIYIAIFILLVIAMVYAESIKKKPINWFPTYTAKHKLPYGTYVLFEELNKMLPSNSIQKIHQPPYLFLKDSTVHGTYLFIDGNINFGKPEFNEILDFVAKGNEVFISTHGINIDTLNLKTKQLISSTFEEKPFFKLINKTFKGKEFSFDKPFNNIVFTKLDTTKSTILGIAGFLDKNNNRVSEGVNFISYSYGKGKFYFHTFPEVFTNYYLLKNNNHQHTEQVLAYINSNKPILWDSYYKTGKSAIKSPMKYLLSNNSLKWAYYTVLLGILLYVLFGGKRVQRIIPIITPLKNQTLAFTKTISNMYLEKSSNKEIVTHKISYLLHYIRTNLQLETTVINVEFKKKVALKSNKSKEEVADLFQYIEHLNSKQNISNLELKHLNKLIENFKK